MIKVVPPPMPNISREDIEKSYINFEKVRMRDLKISTRGLITFRLITPCRNFNETITNYTFLAFLLQRKNIRYQIPITIKFSNNTHDRSIIYQAIF